MGHSFITKFELQIEKTDGSVVRQGVDSIGEAKKKIKEAFNWCSNMSGNAYLWGNSGAGKSYFNKIDCDYYHINTETLKISKAFCNHSIETA